jgi:hypothetical protein
MEHRFFITLLSFSLLLDMINPAILIMVTPQSLLYKTAVVTGFPPGIVAGVFTVCAMLTLPNTVMTILWRNRFEHRNVTKLAVAGFALCGIMWAVMAVAARTLDVEWQVQQYLQNAVISIAFAAALALMLNNQMKRVKRIMQNEAASSV